jgi:hypothetical protein
MKAQYILRRKSGNILAAHLDKLRDAEIAVITIAHGLARIEGVKEEIAKFVKDHQDFTYYLAPKRQSSLGRPGLILPFREPARV